MEISHDKKDLPEQHPVRAERGENEGGENSIDLSKEMISQPDQLAEVRKELGLDSELFEKNDEELVNENREDGIESDTVAKMQEATDSPADDLKSE